MPPTIDKNLYAAAATDTDVDKEIKRMELQTEVKERLHVINKIKNDRPNLYAYIYSKMSLELEDEVKRDTNFATFSIEVDPLAL